MAVAFRPDEVLELAFAVGSEEENGTAQVWLSGELDLAGIPLFAQELERVQRDGRDVEVRASDSRVEHHLADRA